jgi:hypothetical protein
VLINDASAISAEQGTAGRVFSNSPRPAEPTQRRRTMDELTDAQAELAAAAYLLALDGRGMVISDDAYPDAHALAERGWLQRRFEDDGEMSWWWTPQAETALGINAMLASTWSPN